MIDTREAVRWLDVYSDELVSLSLLVRARTLQDKTDEEMCEIYDGLVVAIIEKQKEAMMLAHDIVTATDGRRAGSDSLGDVLGVNAAIQRCVLAIDQAEKALKPPQESFADGMARIHRMVAAKEKEAKEAKQAKEANQGEEASPCAQPDVNDPAADVSLASEQPLTDRSQGAQSCARN